MTRHFLTLDDLGRDGLLQVLDRSAELKRLRGTEEHPAPLAGKSILILMEKSSTRTRTSFEIGVRELGAHPVLLSSRDIQLGRGEPLEDTARVFSGYAHAVVYRTHGHDRIETLAANSSIPVVNALTDRFHPCQLLADLLTARECLGDIEGMRVAWVGDGNNMAHSWMLAAGLIGFDLVLACPDDYQPEIGVLEMSRAHGRGSVQLVKSPDEACKGADLVTTDVWVSMGQEGENSARHGVFSDYCVNAQRMALAADRAIFLHCLPAHRGEEVTAEVIDGPQSRAFQEAENRLHSQKALLEHLLT